MESELRQIIMLPMSVFNILSIPFLYLLSFSRGCAYVIEFVS